MADQDEERLFASLARDKLNRQLPLYAEERQEVLGEKSNHPDPYVRAAVAKHRDTPLEVLQRLAFDTERVVVEALASNWSLPVEVARTLAEHGSDEVAIELARAIKQDPSVIDVLSTRSEDVRVTVALVWERPEHVFRRLAHDESGQVRLALASNSHCPESALRILADDSSPYVRLRVAMHSNSPEDLVTRMREQNPWLTEALDGQAEEAPDSPDSTEESKARE